jgi:hypothetical protein
MKFAVVIGLAILLAQNDCDSSKQNSPPVQQSAEKKPPHPINRFEKLQNFRVDVALDTKTGQLCKTWQWISTNRQNPDSYEDLPLCIALYNQYPD